jgi:hypothetical protein
MRVEASRLLESFGPSAAKVEPMSPAELDRALDQVVLQHGAALLAQPVDRAT